MLACLMCTVACLMCTVLPVIVAHFLWLRLQLCALSLFMLVYTHALLAARGTRIDMHACKLHAWLWCVYFPVQSCRQAQLLLVLGAKFQLV